MTFSNSLIQPLWAEFMVLATLGVTIFADLFIKRSKLVVYLTVQVGLVLAALFATISLGIHSSINFHGHFIHDHLALLTKLFILIISFFAFLYVHQYLEGKIKSKNEFFILALFSILGMMVLASAHSLLTIYLGLELMSLPLYALVAIQRDNYPSIEAAVKYFVIGSVASAMLLYGISLIYGATGTLLLPEVAAVFAKGTTTPSLFLSMGLVFIVLGIAFKLAAAPFHLWAPDVYQGASNGVVIFLSSAPKLAAMVMAIRLLVEGLPGLITQWQHLLAIISVLSLAIGNLVAIAQANIKRMLAYSGIAHAGYLLLGFIAGTEQGYGSALFYTISYSLMAVGAFAVLAIMSKGPFEAQEINDLKGLHARNPWLAFMMLILMFSMGGVPPTLGFFAKLSVIQALIQSNWIGLAVVAVLFSVVGMFYYLRVISVMYFKAPENSNMVRCAPDLRVALTINGFGLLVLGLMPGTLMSVCQAVFKTMH